MLWLVGFCGVVYFCYVFCFFKQKTAYEMRISDWSSDVCSSDLMMDDGGAGAVDHAFAVGAQPQAQIRVLAIGRSETFIESVKAPEILRAQQIGRASCRERVCH